MHNPVPGDLLLHPVAVAAMAAVIVNDQWLKPLHPGAVSGKLSDFAGLIYFPLLVATLIEAGRWIIHRPLWQVGPRLVDGIAVVTGLIFLLAKATAWGGEAYRTVFGVIWWPADAFRSTVQGHGWPPLGRLGLTRDASDLIALPCLAIAAWIARKVSEARAAAETSGILG